MFSYRLLRCVWLLCLASSLPLASTSPIGSTDNTLWLQPQSFSQLLPLPGHVSDRLKHRWLQPQHDSQFLPLHAHALKLQVTYRIHDNIAVASAIIILSSTGVDFGAIWLLGVTLGSTATSSFARQGSPLARIGSLPSPSASLQHRFRPTDADVARFSSLASPPLHHRVRSTGVHFGAI